MSMKHYLAARKEGLKQQHAAQARGQDPYLPVLSELVPTLNKLTQVPLGLGQIALDQIEGTATKGRTTAFSRGFMPLLEPDSEFASKWSVLYDGIVEDGLRQPIVALEYYNRFYIVEGNKRVSVMASARCGEHRGGRHPRPAGAGGQRALPRLSGIFELLRRYEDQFHHLHPRGQL